MSISNIADQITLCRAILLELQVGAGQPGAPIEAAGYTLEDVNHAVGIMVDEGMITASPPGSVYQNSWSAGRITLRGLEFIDAYRADADQAAELDARAKGRGRTETMLETVGGLAKALQFLMPG